jgi:hypothetical protein
VKASTKRQASTTATPPILPTLFVLAAGHAMVGDESVCESQEERLEQTAARVAPLLARRSLLTRVAGGHDLVSLALEAATADNDTDERLVDGLTQLRSMLPADHAWRLGDLVGVSVFNGVAEGVNVGIVAGYMLAQLVAGKDGAQ